MANFNKGREIDLIKYVPDVLADVDEYKAIMTLETKEKKEQWAVLEKLFNSQYILEADEFGISLFEKMHGIKPLDTETLQERRNRVYVLYNDKPPFTRRWLTASLEQMCGGSEHVCVDYLTEKFTIELTFRKVPANIYAQCVDWIDRVIPANMLLTASSKMSDNFNLKYGVLPISIGKKTLGIGFPSGYEKRLWVGMGHISLGRKAIGLGQPEITQNHVYHGQIRLVTGKKTIGGLR